MVYQWRRWAWVGWLLCVHLALLIVVLSNNRICSLGARLGICETQELSPYFHSKRKFLWRRATLVPGEFGLVIGDSHIESLAFEAVDAVSFNAGIGGDTSVGVLQRIGDYEPFERWRYIVFAVGFNDLKFRGVAAVVENYKKLIDRVGPNQTVYVLSVLPVEESAAFPRHGGKNQRIRSLNHMLRLAVSEHENVRFLDISTMLTDPQGNLMLRFHIGDGVHLNDAGREAVICHLRSLLADNIGSTDVDPEYCLP